MQMKNILKQEKGSMAVYVTVVLLTFLIVLSTIFLTSASVRKTQLSTLLRIKQSYEEGTENVQAIYENIVKGDANTGMIAQNIITP